MTAAVRRPLHGLIPWAAVRQTFCDDVKRRAWWRTWGAWLFVVVLDATIVGGLLYASQGTPDPTEATAPESHAVVLVNSAIIVFREGLEAVLILAAVMAPMIGTQRRLRRSMSAGVGVAFAAVVAT